MRHSCCPDYLQSCGGLNATAVWKLEDKSALGKGVFFFQYGDFIQGEEWHWHTDTYIYMYVCMQTARKGQALDLFELFVARNGRLSPTLSRLALRIVCLFSSSFSPLLFPGGSDVVSLDLCETAQYALSIVSYEPTFFHILLDGEQALGSISTFEDTTGATTDNDNDDEQELAFDFEEVSFLIGPGGIQTRERTVIQQPNFLGQECPALYEYQVRWAPMSWG